MTTRRGNQGDARSATDDRKGLSRRAFLESMGVGAAGAALAGAAPPAAAAVAVAQDEGLTPVALRINGRRQRLLVEPRWTLLDVLRDRMGLTGTKIGCGRGECGACTVLIDGTPRYACLVLALEAEEQDVTTVEGVLQGEELGPVQTAFVEEDAFQCGYCTPGQVMAAEGLLRRNPHPGPEEIREGMSGNLCRCGAYKHIFAAVQRAAGAGGTGGR
jgi:xanthine dehydrogenase YagT iron-sulfur-binding subunit